VPIEEGGLAIPPRAVKGVPGIERTKFLRNDKKVAYWNETGQYVNIRGLDQRVPKNPLDIRILGMSEWVRWARIESRWDLDQVVESYMGLKDQMNVEDRDDGLWILTWTYHHSPEWSTTWRVWVDVAHGFTPTRTEDRVNQHQHVEQESTTKWEEINGVWLPVHFSANSTSFGGRIVRQYVFDIAWEQVNAQIPQSLFTVEDFAAPARVGIVDDSLGQKILVRRPDYTTPTNSAPLRSLGIRWWLAGSLAALGAMLAAIWFYRRRYVRT
jgi:hypothetical protein